MCDDIPADTLNPPMTSSLQSDFQCPFIHPLQGVSSNASTARLMGGLEFPKPFHQIHAHGAHGSTRLRWIPILTVTNKLGTVLQSHKHRLHLGRPPRYQLL